MKISPPRLLEVFLSVHLDFLRVKEGPALAGRVLPPCLHPGRCGLTGVKQIIAFIYDGLRVLLGRQLLF